MGSSLFIECSKGECPFNNDLHCSLTEFHSFPKFTMIDTLRFLGLQPHKKYPAEEFTAVLSKLTNTLSCLEDDGEMNYRWQLFTHVAFHAWMIQHRCQPKKALLYVA